MAARRGKDQEDADARRQARGCGWAALALLAAVVVAGAVLATLAAQVLDGPDLDLGIGPGSGKRSERLAVQVSPHTELADGAVVRVTSGAFEENRVVAVAICLEEAATDRRGVAACDTDGGSRFATDGEGRLDQPFTVPRVITVGTVAFDCAASAGRCLLVVADAADFDRSGGVRLSFRSGLPTVDLTPRPARPRSDRLAISATPTGPLAPATQVSVVASGFRPGEPLLIARCTEAFETGPPEDACEPIADTFGDALVAFMGTIGDALPRADDAGTARVVVAVGREVTPFGASSPGDCTAAPGRCSIVVSAAADTRRSAVLPYTLTPP